MIDKQKHATKHIPIRFVDDSETPPAAAAKQVNENVERAAESVVDVNRLNNLASEMIEEKTAGESPIRDKASAAYVSRHFRDADKGEHSEVKRKHVDDYDEANDLQSFASSEQSHNSDSNDFAQPEFADISSADYTPADVADATEKVEAAARQARTAVGPEAIELIATRAELHRVEGELQRAVLEREELQDQLARRQADAENQRRRIERERVEAYHRTVGEVVNKLLPIADNLHRALSVEASPEAQELAEFQQFLNGVRLVNKQLDDVFTNLGVEPIAALGQVFDPHIHEAIATEQTTEVAPDTVVEEIARGYRLGNKLLRPAIVKVAVR